VRLEGFQSKPHAIRAGSTQDRGATIDMTYRAGALPNARTRVPSRSPERSLSLSHDFSCRVAGSIRTHPPPPTHVGARSPG